LDAADVDAYAPKPAGEAAKENLRRRGLLFLASGDFPKARAYFTQALASGQLTAQPYLDRLEIFEKGEVEVRAKRDWVAAEEKFKAQQLKEAHLMYLAFEREHAKTKVYAENAAALKQRIAAIEAALNPIKPGLVAMIYKGNEFKPEDLLQTRVDAKVEYDWGGGAPGEGLPSDNFSFRWLGAVKVEKAGHYTFATSADDGTRIFVDGKQLTNDWTTHPSTRIAGEIDLAPGLHEFKLEYFEGGGGAACKLYWALKDGFGEGIIPPDVLFHDPKLEGKPAPQPEKKP
ncbi:MAG: hypothetical protein HY291_19765, partial [Planctomycetes bacterium]|nr:hypothetical protein [Planctomycetota bacterium]